MLTTRISESNWRKFYLAAEHAEKIRNRVLIIVELLSDIFTAENEVGLKFHQISEWPVCAAIESPVGGGRLRLEWAVGEDGIDGLVVVDRQVLGDGDRLEFKPVWAFTVPEYGEPFIGTRDDRFALRTHSQFGGQVRNTMYELGMSILYAVATGKKD